MRELTIAETEHAAGGLAVSATIAVSVGAGIAAAYIYEKLGGAKGIEEKLKAAANLLVQKKDSILCPG